MIGQVTAQLAAGLTVGLLAGPLGERVLSGAATVDPWGSLVQYGPLGLGVLGFATGWIVAGPQYRSLQAENARLNALIEGRLLPMIDQYSSTMTRASDALEKSAVALTEVSHALTADRRER